MFTLWGIFNISLSNTPSTFPLAIDCRQDKGKVIDYSNSVREFFSDETFEAIPAIHKNNKIPDTESLALLLAL